jgi:hypothetical protein
MGGISEVRPRNKQLYNSRYWATVSQTSMPERQKWETATEEQCFLCGPCRNVISRTTSESQLRVDSWSNELVVRQSSASKNVSKEAEDIVGIRHQATTGKDIANWISNAVRVSYLFVVTFCKCSINAITNPNPVYSHSHTWQYRRPVWSITSQNKCFGF